MNSCNRNIDCDLPPPILQRAWSAEDPYPTYSAIRNAGQPIRMSLAGAEHGVWLFASYADALTVLRQSTAGSARLISGQQNSVAPFNLNLLKLNGHNHSRVRGLIADFFSAQALQALTPTIYAIAENLVCDLRYKQSVDLVSEFASLLPLRVIGHLVGIPEVDLPQIRQWSNGIMIDDLHATPERAGQRRQCLTEITAYLSDLLDYVQKPLLSGILSRLNERSKAGEISRDEMIGTLILLLTAGQETTVHLIGNGLWLLLTHPLELASLVSDPRRIPEAVEEILRFESPAQRSTFRVATTQIEFQHGQIEPGELLAAMIGAANRDDKVFQDPERFVIQRSPNPHLAFGAGKHYCIGKSLARLEARIALHAILDPLSRATLRQKKPSWKKDLFFRGHTSILVKMD
jgi:pimeloyl-[acyl-carrier protein] synthase